MHTHIHKYTLTRIYSHICAQAHASTLRIETHKAHPTHRIPHIAPNTSHHIHRIPCIASIASHPTHRITHLVSHTHTSNPTHRNQHIVPHTNLSHASNPSHRIRHILSHKSHTTNVVGHFVRIIFHFFPQAAWQSCGSTFSFLINPSGLWALSSH